jgi:hypothetical protein
MSDDDRDLRDRFARLRDEDRAHLPAFRVAREAPRWTWSPRVLIAAAIILIALVLARPDRTPTNPSIQFVDLRAATWRSPTDFLLVTPGSELLRSVPEVGLPDVLAPIELRGRSPAPESTRT